MFSEKYFLKITLNKRTFFCSILLILFWSFLFSSFCFAEIIDRVVAFVDDQAITLSDLQEQYSSTVKLSPEVSMNDVLNTMINRILLLRAAKKIRIEGHSVEEILKEYIDLKIRAFIRVGESDIEIFYKENIVKFSHRDLEDVREDIEKYLIEKELNVRLKETLNDLRNNAYIKIQIRQE